MLYLPILGRQVRGPRCIGISWKPGYQVQISNWITGLISRRWGKSIRGKPWIQRKKFGSLLERSKCRCVIYLRPTRTVSLAPRRDRSSVRKAAERCLRHDGLPVGMGIDRALVGVGRAVRHGAYPTGSAAISAAFSSMLVGGEASETLTVPALGAPPPLAAFSSARRQRENASKDAGDPAALRLNTSRPARAGWRAGRLG